MDRPPAPDFTRAFLASLAPLVFVGLFAIWASLGLIAALAAGYAADRAIAALEAR